MAHFEKNSVWENRIKNIMKYLEKIQYPYFEYNSIGEYDKKPAVLDDSTYDEDSEFIARMILGVKYDNYMPELQMKNCFIELLNGNYDVDKLDYTIRDTKMSGISNVTLDVERLLGSLTIIPTTVYINKEIDICEDSLVITNLIPKVDEELVVEGGFDRFLSMMNCEVEFKKNSTVRTFSPKNAGTNDGITTDGCKVSNESKVLIEHKEIERGTEYKSISTVKDKCLELFDVEFLDECRIKIGDKLYQLLSDKNSNFSIKLLKESHIDINQSVVFSGSIKGRVKKLEILSDKLSEIQLPPTQNLYTGFSLGYNKQAVNLLSNVTEARNYLYKWIYSHHKVAYYANYLIVELSRLSTNYVMKENLDTILTKYMLDDNSLWMVDEGFVHNTIREMYKIVRSSSKKENKYVKLLCDEYISRVYKTSLYKSLAEFDIVFSAFNSDDSRTRLYNHLEKISELYYPKNKGKRIYWSTNSPNNYLKYGIIKKEEMNEILKSKGDLTEYIDEMIWVSANPSLTRPSPSKIFISFNNIKCISPIDRIAVLNMGSNEMYDGKYFYLFYRIKNNSIDSATIKEKALASIVAYFEKTCLLTKN